MKRYTNEAQTATLITMGFDKPKSVNWLSLDIDMDTVPHFDYSIGELLEFLSAKNISINKDGDYWYADIGSLIIGRYSELIDLLFCACETLKEDGMI